jgi:hypothetical protein
MTDYRKDLEDPELKFVPISFQHLARAVFQVETCEKCNPHAKVSFDWVLCAFAYSKDDVEYIMPAPGSCPRCRADIHEKTRVQPIGRRGAAISI